MILTIKQKKIIRSTIFLGVLLISTFSAMNTIFNGQQRFENVPEHVNHIKSIPSSSAFWTNTSIIIDATATTNTSHSGNWTWAVAQDWCTGFGTWEQPYLIENMTFTADYDMDGLLIKNSVKDYFKIKNCTFLNATTNYNSAGLYLDNTTNGTITECNMSTNNIGLLIGDNCNNISIIENNVSAEDIGIKFESYAYNNTVLNNSIENSYQGIYLQYSERIQIIDNELTNCARGIELSKSINNTVQNNSVIDNSQYGIQCLQQSHNNTFIENTIKNSVYNDFKIRLSNNSILLDNVIDYKGLLLDESYHNQINQGNTVSGKPIYYYEDQNDLDLNGNTITNIGQLFLINCNNSIISNFEISNVSIGIYIDYGNQISISNNNVSNNYDYGLILRNINQSSIIGNIASNNRRGLFYENDVPNYFDEENPDLSLLLGENIFSENIANNNEQHGFEVYYSKFDTFSNNVLNNNSRNGLNLNYNFNSTISYNQVRNNIIDGIGFHYSYNNSISENEIINNSYGIYLEISNHTKLVHNQINLNEVGIYLYDTHHSSIENNEITSNLRDGISFEIANDTKISGNIIAMNNETGITIDTESHDNIIFLNYFLQNFVHAEDNGFNNLWFFDNVGNYWDNYTGNDADNNGIGDQPYNISGTVESQDLYPIFNLDAPTIEAGDDCIINGNIAYTLSWIVSDINPNMYYITRDGVVIVSPTSWTNGTISYVITADSLTDGIYTYILWINDTTNNQDSASIAVTVDSIAPTITSLESLTLSPDLFSVLVSWTLADLHPGEYSISFNGTEVVPFTVWTNGTVTYNLSIADLLPGNYSLIITVRDLVGNEMTADLIIVIEEDPNEIGGWLIFLFIVIGLSATSITSMIILKKTSPEKYNKVMEKLKGFFGNFKNIGKSDKKK